MNRLIIAEKPSLGRAIAAVLPKPHKKHQGYIEAGNGDHVTWCVGHLLEQLSPDEYDERYKQWRLDTLPITVSDWRLKPRKGMTSQIAVVRKLVKQAQQIVHAGDPDREGQLLVDELLDYVKLTQAKKSSVQRLLVNDLNPAAIKKALNQLRPNKEFVPLSVSALARSRADWLYGMNLSRAYTLLGKQMGYNGVLSVGRVQTPVLGLVVRRDQQIEQFQPKPFFQLDAFIDHQGTPIVARWQPSDACAKWLDEDGRLLSRKLAEHVAARIVGQSATVAEFSNKTSKHAVPLPYSLSTLQIDAAKRFGMSAQQVLDAAQKLYEQHQLITYPRSDCRYLPKGHLAESGNIVAATGQIASGLSDAASKADLSLRSRCWNDSKVSAHHAIIPTTKSSGGDRLGRDEAKVYELIARQYLMQFYPAAQFSETSIEFIIEGGSFIAKGKTLTVAGWRQLLPPPKEKSEPYLPTLAKGQQLPCVDARIKDCMTEPPKAFTEATLLQAMTGIGRFVLDSSLKQVLKETDGLGTEATRAGIIELLFKRQFLKRQGKSIHATEAGRALIEALPESATYPDMTAKWERQLGLMAEKKAAYEPFMDELGQTLAELIATVQQQPAPRCLAQIPAAPQRKFKRRKSSAGARSKNGKKNAAQKAAI